MIDDLQQLNKIFEGFFDAARDKQRLEKVGLLIERIIKTRTRAWRDVEGSRFEAYSELYKRKRIEAGLAIAPMGKDTDSMLVWDSTDGMMQSIESIVANDFKNVVVDITRPEKKKLAYYHSESGVGEKGKHIRKFWGLSIPETKFIAENYVDGLETVFAGLVEKTQKKIMT